MATTTWDAIRNDMITQMETSTTPTSRTDAPFRVHDATAEFLDEVENTPSSLRLFEISDLLEDDSGAALNDKRLIEGTFEVRVAYPEDSRYGNAGSRDREKVMNEDYYTIDNSIGLKGYQNISNVTVWSPSKDVLDLEGARVLEISYRAIYCRAS